MLPALSPQIPLNALHHRQQAARSHDSDGGINVLAEAPGGALRGRIELLTDTTELQPALMEAINEARTSIKADFHLLKGPQGQELARQLARRARQGLRVQILAWGRPSAPLIEAIKVARSHGLTVRLGKHDGPAHDEPSGKLLLVDDRLALVGVIKHPTTSRYARRGLLRLTGEAAGELGRQFNHDWAAAGGQPLPLPELHGAVRGGTRELQSMVQIGGVGPQRKAAKALLLAALGRARAQVHVLVDSLDDPELLAAMVAAKKRGVQVKVLLGGQLPSRARFGDPQARAIAVLGRAHVPVRRYQAQGAAQGVELRFALVDGESLLFGTMPWTRAGLASGGELMIEARGGRELALIQATFLHDWQHAGPVDPPSGWRRVAAEVAPLMVELGRVIGRYSPAGPAKTLMNLHVGVVKYPGGKWKVMTEVRG